MIHLSTWNLSSPQRVALPRNDEFLVSPLHSSPVQATGNLTQFHSWECDRMHHRQRERRTDRKRHESKVVAEEK